MCMHKWIMQWQTLPFQGLWPWTEKSLQVCNYSQWLDLHSTKCERDVGLSLKSSPSALHQSYNYSRATRASPQGDLGAWNLEGAKNRQGVGGKVRRRKNGWHLYHLPWVPKLAVMALHSIHSWTLQVSDKDSQVCCHVLFITHTTDLKLSTNNCMPVMPIEKCTCGRKS